MRSWLSEQECAEYWYVVKDDGFWAKLKRKIGTLFGASAPEYRLNSVIWSPFSGDKLYPFFDDSNNLVAFSREYKKKDLDDVEITCFMTITTDSVYQWGVYRRLEIRFFIQTWIQEAACPVLLSSGSLL